MKKTIITALFTVFAVITANAQLLDCEQYEICPRFPGGDKALLDFIKSNMCYPKCAKEKGIEGRVIVSFYVETDGGLTNLSIAKSVDSCLNKEALRIIKEMPKWEPGQLGGKIVRMKYHLPIEFRCKDSTKSLSEMSGVPTSSIQQTRDILEINFPTGTDGFMEVYDVMEERCDTLPIVNGRMVMEQSNLPKTLQLKYMKERLDSNKVWISINQRDIRRGDLIVGHGHTILTIDSLSSRRIIGTLEDEFGDFEACHQYWRDRQRFRSEEFLKAHSQSVWALYHLDLDWDADTLQVALNCFSESLRNSERGKKLQQLIMDRKSKTGVAKLFPMWDTAGKAHSFEECVGDKDYMLLNLWASWCGPCRAEIPDLMAYFEECRERVAFVSVTIDEKREAWLKAVEAEPKYEWPNLASKFDGTPKGRQLPLLFNPGYIPFFFIIDRHGNTVYSSLEQKTDDRPLDDAKRRLNELLTK